MTKALIVVASCLAACSEPPPEGAAPDAAPEPAPDASVDTGGNGCGIADIPELAAATRVYWVDPAGDDTAAGTEQAPFRTISRAAELLQPGEAVYVRAGVYRERVAPARGGTEALPITYFAECGGQVVIKGSDAWAPDWQSHGGGVYSAVPDSALFTDDVYLDDANPFRVAMSSTPYGRNGRPEAERGIAGADPEMVYTLGQVFVDGEPLEQRPYLAEVEAAPGRWSYDAASGAIYVHLDGDPHRASVEITTRRRIFAPHRRGLAWIRVIGFVMEHCGNQYPTNFWSTPAWQQAGALGTRSGEHWVIRGNVIRRANGIGIDLGREGGAGDLERGDNGDVRPARGHVVEGNLIVDNGGGGTAGYNPEALVIRGNVIARNNTLRLTGTKRWESAGLKLHSPDHSLIEGNLIRDNYGTWGVWLDGGAGKGTRFTRNLVVGHKVGFDLELGKLEAGDVLLDDNVFIDNKEAIGSRESSGMTAAHNLIVGSEVAFKYTVNPGREGAGTSWTAMHHRIANNLVIACERQLELDPPTAAQAADRTLDGNVYDAAAADKEFVLRGSAAKTFAQWQTAWAGFNGADGAEQHSQLASGNGYRFDAATLTLTLDLGFDPAQTTTVAHPGVDLDYDGAPVPAEGAKPGPFQDLAAGTSVRPLW